MIVFDLKTFDISHFFGRASRALLYRFLKRHFNSRDSKFEVFAWKVLQTSTFHGNRFLPIPGSNSVVFSGPWTPLFQFSCALKTSLKTGGFLIVSNVLFKARSACG